MMDGSNNKNPSSIPTQHHYSSHHLLPPSSSSSSMPFSSYFPSSTNLVDESGDGGDEDSGSGGFGGFGGKGKPPELDFDAHDCDSEEGIGEENTRRAPPRNGSGSKRTRAAEVHNLSEKRRRSRINEKMKALQNLIPNSNKTDKASMLDEAIEYLKQLQLQVQMLSMRNGLNLHPMYMPLHPSSQLNMDFAADHGSTVNMGVSMLPLSLDSSSRNSHGLSNQCESSHQPIILPNAATSMNTIGTSFGIGLSHPHHGCFQLPVNDAIFREGIEPNAGMHSGNSTRNLQGSTLEDTGAGLAGGMIGGEMSGDVLTKDADNRIFIQHLHGKR